MTVTLVTGSSGAIGSAVCRAFRDRGDTVVGIDVADRAGTGPDTDPVGDGASRPEHRLHIADAADGDDIRTVFEQTEREYGPVTTLVNNAGAYAARDFLDTDDEQFDSAMRANVRSTFVCTRELGLRARSSPREGRVVNVASVSGELGSMDAAYGASKGAVIALTKSTAIALAPLGIRVVAVAPGVINGPMADRIPADRRDSYIRATLLRRFGEPDEIAQLVLALAGPAGDYLTGTVVDANGGLH